MSFEETADLTDLCEYDEFDSYDDNTYQTTSSSNFTEYGVPLSVELSESLCKNQTAINEQTSNGFVKAPEIFLRFDTNVSSTTDFTSGSSKQNNDSNLSNELKNCVGTISLESKENDNIRDDCVELQYESEFKDPRLGVDDDNTQVIYKRKNSLDNDYEELLLEGIK